MGIVVAADEIDIGYAKLAMSKAKDKQVKDFAQQMINDHSSVQKSVLGLAAKLNVTPAESGTHMLGSASIQLLVQEDSKRRSVIFSGDLGPKGVAMLRDFEPFQHADLVFLESLYGNRNNRPLEETVEEFVHVVTNAVSGGAEVLVLSGTDLAPGVAAGPV